MNYNLVTNLVVKLEEDDLINLINEFIQLKPSREEALKVLSSFQKGMTIIGRKFEQREYAIGDVIYAGELQGAVLDLLKPIIGQYHLNAYATQLRSIYGESKNIGEQVFKKTIESSDYATGYTILKETVS